MRKACRSSSSRFDDFIDLHGWMTSLEDSRASKLINMLMVIGLLNEFIIIIIIYYSNKIVQINLIFEVSYSDR